MLQHYSDSEIVKYVNRGSAEVNELCCRVETRIEQEGELDALQIQIDDLDDKISDLEGENEGLEYTITEIKKALSEKPEWCTEEIKKILEANGYD